MFGLKPSFKEEVLRNLVSEEPNVKFVVQKVALGEVDAGIVYQTDVTIAKEAGSFAVIPIPSSANVKAKYPMAVLKEAPEKKLQGAYPGDEHRQTAARIPLTGRYNYGEKKSGH